MRFDRLRSAAGCNGLLRSKAFGKSEPADRLFRPPSKFYATFPVGGGLECCQPVPTTYFFSFFLSNWKKKKEVMCRFV